MRSPINLHGFLDSKSQRQEEILPALIQSMENHQHPFTLSIEASINISDDEELMQLMVHAEFETIFVGIESLNEGSLVKCKKIPNKNRDLMTSIMRMQKRRIQVQGGFIVGFDSDPPSTFDMLIDFISETGIETVMVGLLNSPHGTRLYQRLIKDGRMLNSFTGNNKDLSMNFIPNMKYDVLLAGHKKSPRTV